MLQEAKEVCPTITRRLISEGALLVDVRELHEIEALAFDVPAIMNIPLFELENRWSEIPKDREVVLVCQGGGRSLKATYYLQYYGYTNVSNMGGGIVKWTQKGFPVKGPLQVAGACETGSCGPECDPADPENASCCAPTSAAQTVGSCCD